MQQLFSLVILLFSPTCFGGKFAHPQEHSLTVYTAFRTMHRHCCRPVPRFRWKCQGQFHLNRGTGRQQCRCIVPKAVYTKSAPEDGRIFRPKHVG